MWRMRASRLTGWALATAVVLAVPAAAPAAEPLRPYDELGPLGNERLSNERTLSRWAHPAHAAHVLARPARGARTVARLRYRTEDGRPEVYLLLRSRIVRRQGTWIQLRIPGRPNGRTGWVPRWALASLHRVRGYLLLDKSRRRAYLFRNGRSIWTSPIGHGAPGTPTPSGNFWIRERLKGLGGIYGPWAFGTAGYSVLSDWPRGGVVGIHGTNQPELIPGRPSHGCVRVPNSRVRVLARLLAIGTPLRIRP